MLLSMYSQPKDRIGLLYRLRSLLKEAMLAIHRTNCESSTQSSYRMGGQRHQRRLWKPLSGLTAMLGMVYSGLRSEMGVCSSMLWTVVSSVPSRSSMQEHGRRKMRVVLLSRGQA
jgi:hypothetical protein